MGFMPGDVFIEINDTSVVDWSLTEVVDCLRGKANTFVEVAVLRGERKLDRVVIRKQIINKSITFSNLDTNGIGIIRVNQFLIGGGDRFREVVQEFVDHEAKGIIVDLRTNPGFAA